MKKRIYTTALLLLTVLVCDAQRPNIIFILADDLGYGDLKKLNKDAQVQTPNMTRLANEGLICTNAHSASSVCTPSRYGIITGRYAFRTSLKKGLLGGYSPALIEEDRFTVADLAKNAGYTTAIIGKWHLGLDWKPRDASKPAVVREGKLTIIDNADLCAPVSNGPHKLGFDYSYILPASLDMSPYFYLENGQCTDCPLDTMIGKNSVRGVFYRDGYRSKSFVIEQTLDHCIDKAKQYIGETSRRNQPFFLYLPLTAPHEPWLPADRFKNKSNAGLYGDWVMHTDDAIGRIMNCLDSLHLTENTLVILTSDNGADWKPKDEAAFPKHRANYIFRGEKSDIWDGGHHVPLILRWPAGIKANQRNDALICLNDLMATLAGLMRSALPDSAGPDSYNLWPVLRGTGKSTRPDIIHHSIKGMFAIRKGKWKFVDGSGSGGWSPSDPNDKAPGQLYDMEKDERETTNLYNKYPEVVKELKALLEKQKEQGFSISHGTPSASH